MSGVLVAGATCRVRVLLLGGTAEARDLASRLVDAGVEVTSSLAGRVARPRLPVGAVRIGGFGGVAGLRQALAEYDVVVDATHPFAQGISANVLAACETEGVPLLRLERPGWDPDPSWRYVTGHEEAAALTAQLGRRPLLTVGRQHVDAFVPHLGDHRVLARVVDPPDLELPRAWRVVLSRGPYTVEGDLALMRDHRCDALVTKDSGGTYTRSKLEAAGALGVPVVVVARPAPDPRALVVHAVGPALDWVLSCG